jgi:hypothetical protein
MIQLSTINEALKVLYINPIREFVNMKADPLAARILQTSDNITGYQKIVRAVQIGANGGAGAGTETGLLPVAGENLYKQFESDIKNLYGTVSISDKTMKSATEGPGSFINALQRDIDTLVETLKFSLARQIYGDGSGVLVKLKNASSGVTEVEAADGEILFNVLPGLTVDVYNGTTLANHATSQMRVVDVNHTTRKITLSAATSAALTGNGGALYMQGSKGLELTGLGAIFDTTNVTTLYGLTRANYSWMQPYVKGSLGALTEWKIQDAVNTIEDVYDVSINHIAAGNTAYQYYMEMMNYRRAINDVMILEGGHKALKFNGMPLVRNKFLAPATIDLYDTNLFTIDQIADWEWLDDGVHGILQRNARYATYEGSIAKYCNLMCRLPAGIGRLTGITAPDNPVVATVNVETTTAAGGNG